MRRTSIVLMTSLAGLAMTASAASAAPVARVRVGSSAYLPAHTRVVAPLPADTDLQLTVALQPRDPAALAAFATGVSTPTSPLYHHYISVPQFAQRFGATPAQIAAVQSQLRAQGLTVGAPTANNLSLKVTATAAEAEQAFSVSLSKVKTPDGRTAYANVSTAPAVPAGAAPYVQGVIGLDDVTPNQHQAAYSNTATTLAAGPAKTRASGTANVITGGPQPCSTATQAGAPANFSNAAAGYTADLLATAYSFPPLYAAGAQGGGQTVALFEQQPYQVSDIATYQACFGTSVPVSPIDVDGGPGAYTPPTGGGGGGDGEAALDIEVVAGMAPKSSILVYQGPPTATAPIDILTAMVTQNRAKVLSSSWGACEAATPGPQITAENTVLQEAAAQGQSFFISSGDTGSHQCAQLGTGNNDLSVLDPAGQPFATGVGGTSLYTATEGGNQFYSGGAATEGVWNDAPTGSATHGSGSGGGISKQWTMPSYQSGAAASLGVINSNSSNVPCGTGSFCREVPDISADADSNTGYTVYNDGAWNVIGGTSAAAPLWAAFIGVANSSAACRGVPIGFVNPSLYAIAGSTYLSNFHDVANASPFSGVANNDTINGSGLFPTTPSYDMTTGIGTPIASTLAASLCGRAAPVYTVSVTNPGTRTGKVGTPLSIPVKGTDSGGAPLSFAATGLPAGLRINPANGVISGTPTKAGASTVAVSAGDRFANRGSTRFAVTIAPAPPSTARVSLSGIAKRKAKFAFTVAAGLGAPSLKSITVTAPSGLTFSKAKKSLSKGVVVKNSAGKRLKFKAKVSGRKLTITLSSATAKATVSLASPALGVTKTLAKNVKRHKTKTLTFVVKATDSAHHATTLKLKHKAS
jgi:subtilase family serine protease